MAESQFDPRDTNQDGVVSVEEALAAHPMHGKVDDSVLIASIELGRTTHSDMEIDLRPKA